MKFEFRPDFRHPIFNAIWPKVKDLLNQINSENYRMMMAKVLLILSIGVGILAVVILLVF